MNEIPTINGVLPSFGGGIENFSSGSGSSALTLESSSSTTIGGGVQTFGSGGSQCLKTAVTHMYYLYDNGVLLATFDENDDIIETFVNAQEGMIASYKNNDDDKLYYFMRDQSVEEYTITDSLGNPYTDPGFTFLTLGGTKIQGEYEWLSSAIFDL